jgi:hypothetical protein
MHPIKLQRIYPKVYPENAKKAIAKTALESVVGEMLNIGFAGDTALTALTLHVKKWLRKKNPEDWILFENDQIMVSGSEPPEKEVFSFSAIEALKVSYHRNLVIEAETHLDEQYFQKQISRIEFTCEGREHAYFFDCKKSLALKLCKTLYEKGIVFKEYNEGRRVYMGKKPKYSEIQKLKKRYNMEW